MNREVVAMLRSQCAILLSLGFALGQAHAEPEHPAPKKDAHGKQAQGDDAKKDGHAKKSDGEKLVDARFDLTIWTIVIFVLLLLVLKKVAWGPMLEGLQKREHSIRQALDDARLAHEETEKLRVQFKKDSEAASAEIARQLEKSRRDGEILIEEMHQGRRGHRGRP